MSVAVRRRIASCFAICTASLLICAASAVAQTVEDVTPPSADGAATAQQEPVSPDAVDVPPPAATVAPSEVFPAPGDICLTPPVACNSPFAGSLCERPYLLGSVGGWRDELAGKGVDVNLSSTQFYQGVVSGGIRQQFQFSGRTDLLVNIAGEQAGLWKGSFFTLHAETRYGETVNGDTGAIIPVNTGALFPQPTGSPTALTAVKMTQALSESFVVFGGKINALDELVQPYASGRGVDSFMNMGVAFPLAAARQVPYSTLGAGFAVLHEMQPVFSFMLLDTHNNPTTSGFDDLFANGVTMLVKAEKPVCLFDRPGHQSLWGVYSSGKYNDLQPTAYFDPNVGPVVTFGQDTGSWSVFYSADQAFWVDPENPKRSWGLFTNVGLADNGPSPIRWSANIGLGGSSPIDHRPLDTFGIGYAFTGFSDPVKNLAPILLPVGNDQAVELFYNYAVTPWLRVTPDLQIVIPARERTLPPDARDIDTAVVFGLRAKIIF